MGGCEDIAGHLRAAGPGYRRGLPYRLVAVQGRDAVDFLQRLCSQDVAALEPGRCAPGGFLNPKGKLVAACHALRTEKGFFLEVESALTGVLAGILEQFHFAEKLEIRVPGGQECAAWMGGAEVFELSGLQHGACAPVPDGIAYAAVRHGLCRVHYHAPEAFFAVPPWEGRAQPWSEEQADAFRIASGLLRMGVDADQDTLALEAGLDDHVSLSKGCYTGQEIVARIHTYGHVNRKLCLLSVDSGEVIPVGTGLVDADGKAVGKLGSSAPLKQGMRIALGYLVADRASVGDEARAGGVRVTVCGFGKP